MTIPTWALAELQEDLQDAAVDLGAGWTPLAEDRYELAASKLRRALEIVGAR